MGFTMEERLFMALDKPSPAISLVTRNFQKLMKTGSVNDREHHPKRTVTHKKNSLVISRMIEENNGKISTRQLASDTNMSRSSVMKVLKDRKLFPYKKRYVNEMRPEDSVERLTFYLKTKGMVEEGLFIGPLLVFSDEAYFHLTGHINK
uniref:HTH_Tnp_Tc3_2 domain-containing protein n=1 Tax=Strongyloides papillosus TaxID=174720 RepID=A0A0N5C214_STREA